MGVVDRIRRRSPADYPRLIVAACLLLAVDVALEGCSFARLHGGLVRVGETLDGLVPGNPPLGRVVWAVEAADVRIPGDRTCLVRSLSAEMLVRLYGFEPRHRIGVDPDDEFAAHSWLEYDGEVVIGDDVDLDRYEPLPPLQARNVL